MIKVADIQREVAEHYSLPVEAMREPAGIGTRANAPARQLGICLAARLTQHTSVRIGQFFGGRDHSTVLFAVSQAEKRIARDPETREAARVVTKRLLNARGVL